MSYAIGSWFSSRNVFHNNLLNFYTITVIYKTSLRILVSLYSHGLFLHKDHILHLLQQEE